VVGLQVFAFALLLLQNKFYFDEIYRMNRGASASVSRVTES